LSRLLLRYPLRRRLLRWEARLSAARPRAAE